MVQLRRVLILEENTDHLELLTGLLETRFAPIDIHTVENIEDCLDFLEQTEYDLILTGCFIHHVCITDRLPHIVERAASAPIIVISGSGDEKIAAEVIKRGGSEYVVKTRKALEDLSDLVEKYFKKQKSPSSKPAPILESKEETANRLLREVDRLMQKARHFTTAGTKLPLPDEMSNLDSLLSQIERLRKVASKITEK